MIDESLGYAAEGKLNTNPILFLDAFLGEEGMEMKQMKYKGDSGRTTERKDNLSVRKVKKKKGKWDLQFKEQRKECVH